jgi:serine/threonine protein phosphatase PrpC
VAAGVIGPEEVHQHPQRSQIYRSLGAKPEVDVDIFTETMQRGDVLILCSDGLWEMVLDADIARLVVEAPTPQATCDALIREANLAGGEDNVTVIVVRLE